MDRKQRGRRKLVDTAFRESPNVFAGNGIPVVQYLVTKFIDLSQRPF
jgi:hypothetical protein